MSCRHWTLGLPSTLCLRWYLCILCFLFCPFPSTIMLLLVTWIYLVSDVGNWEVGIFCRSAQISVLGAKSTVWPQEYVVLCPVYISALPPGVVFFPHFLLPAAMNFHHCPRVCCPFPTEKGIVFPGGDRGNAWGWDSYSSCMANAPLFKERIAVVRS